MINIYNLVHFDEFVTHLEDIYEYIAFELCDMLNGMRIYNKIWQATESLKIFPNRGALLHKNSNTLPKYRQRFVENYTIIYYVEGDTVYIVDILYSASDIASKFEGEVNGNF